MGLLPAIDYATTRLLRPGSVIVPAGIQVRMSATLCSLSGWLLKPVGDKLLPAAVIAHFRMGAGAIQHACDVSGFTHTSPVNKAACHALYICVKVKRGR